MNAATSIITTKSPYIARTSSTTPQLNYTLGAWAAKHGIKTVYTMVSDYGPGIDAETWFQTGFKEGGGRDHRLGALSGGQSGFLCLRSGAPRTPIRTPSTSGFPAARSPARSAKRWPSAAST